MPNAYDFTGDAVTFLGLVGVFSTALIVVTAFRRFYNSPYNYRLNNAKKGYSPSEQSNQEG